MSLFSPKSLKKLKKFLPQSKPVEKQGPTKEYKESFKKNLADLLKTKTRETNIKKPIFESKEHKTSWMKDVAEYILYSRERRHEVKINDVEIFTNLALQEGSSKEGIQDPTTSVALGALMFKQIKEETSLSNPNPRGIVQEDQLHAVDNAICNYLKSDSKKDEITKRSAREITDALIKQQQKVILTPDYKAYGINISSIRDKKSRETYPNMFGPSRPDQEKTWFKDTTKRMLLGEEIPSKAKQMWLTISAKEPAYEHDNVDVNILTGKMIHDNFKSGDKTPIKIEQHRLTEVLESFTGHKIGSKKLNHLVKTVQEKEKEKSKPQHSDMEMT